MADNFHTCPHCGINTFKSRRGLVQHQQSNKKCAAAILHKFGLSIYPSFPHHTMPLQAAIPAKGRHFHVDDNNVTSVSNVTNTPFFSSTLAKSNSFVESEKLLANADEESGCFPMSDDSEDAAFDIDSTDCIRNVPTPPATFDTKKHFLDYSVLVAKNFGCFTNSQHALITLINRSRKTKASLGTYEAIMDWHCRVTGTLNDRQKLSSCSEYVPRQWLFSTLRK